MLFVKFYKKYSNKLKIMIIKFIKEIIVIYYNWVKDWVIDF